VTDLLPRVRPPAAPPASRDASAGWPVSGISTEWDFVEVPSQLFEEWGRDATVLQRFARHHESGEPIPLPLVERMRAADEFGKGLATRVQMFYAALALEYFRSDPAGSTRPRSCAG
jgi:thimet oligopeptidase